MATGFLSTAMAQRPTWQRWGFAGGALAVAVALRHLLEPYAGGVPLLTMYTAVAFTVWFAGWREAVTMMVAGYVIGLWLFLPGLATWRLWEEFGLFRTAVYFFSATTTIFLCESMRRAERRRALTEARVVAILDQMEDCFCAVDRSWRITALNRSAEKMLNIPRDTAARGTWWQLLPRLAGTPGERALRRGMSDGVPVRFETDVLLPGVWTAVSASPAPDGLSIFFQDITDKKTYVQRLEAEVAERTSRLQETIADLEAFSYTLVHDMRAPLRSIRSFAGILAADHASELPQRSRENLARIEKSATRMDRLIEDVLAYSQLSARKPDLQIVDLNAILRELVRSDPTLEPAHADIQIDTPLPLVRGNEALLTQCFGNLLQNATKFVAEGVRPQVRIHAERQGERVRVCVADNGIGVAPEARERIFQPFQREHARYEGSGVGLAIVRKILHRLQGNVTVDSELGRGSRFWVELEHATTASIPARRPAAGANCETATTGRG